MSELIQVNVELTLFLGGFSTFIILLAFSRGFFVLSKEKEIPSFNFSHVFIGFLIYFSSILFLTPVILKITTLYFPSLYKIDRFSLANCTALFMTAIALCLFANIKNLTNDIRLLGKGSIIKNLWTGFLAWVIATPMVLFVSHLLDLFLFFVLKVESIPEQLAVQFIRTTLESPFSFFLALISVVLLAPFVEEFLFRALLQTWLKKRFRPLIAIAMSSISFSLFHFSKLQEIGNVTILGALFPLAFFLGFVYEKQRSLIAPITLHAMFNASSLVSLIFF